MRSLEKKMISIASNEKQILTSNSALKNTLNRLPYTTETPFNSYQNRHEPTYLDNTRVDILQKISDWADEQDERYIFWLNGLAGTGKSIIARTIARKYYKRKRLGAVGK